MPTPSETLTEAFRAAEQRRALLVATAVAVYWKQRVNAEDPKSVERWLAAMVPLILRERAASNIRGVLYGNTIRTLEVGLDDGFRFETTESGSGDVSQAIRTSLMVTAPVDFRRRLDKISGQDISPAIERALLNDAMDATGAAAGGAAARHVQNGGRSALIDGVLRDKKALGWVRVTKTDPCYFCALLSSRGAVYKADSFEDSDTLFDGPGKIKVHDSCGCSLAPLYRRDDPLLDRSGEFLDIYTKSTRGKSGRAAILAFRRAYEGRSSTG
jgi:hypothetical protein